MSVSRLVDRDIRARCGSNPETSLIYPFDKDSLQPCSYDLHLASDYMDRAARRQACRPG